MIHGRSLYVWGGIVILIAISGIFFVGVLVGRNNTQTIEKMASIVNKEPLVVFESTQTDFESFWKVWNLINEKFAPINGTTTDQEKIWGAIEGLVGSLNDDYSVFLPPVDAEIFEETLSGNFGGVGIEIGIRDEVLTVIAPLKNTPAEKAGILTNDRITKIDGTSTEHLSIDEAVRMIRGEIETPVTLTIARKGVNEPFDVTMVRAIIAIPTIDTEKRDDGIFVIKLYNFSATSPGLFREALREFVLSNYDKLLLDLRGNAGGFLEAAVDIASWFLPAGKTVTVEDFVGRKDDIVHRSRGYNIFGENLKMVILVNGGSASASEILAGALSEYNIAQLIGEKTFGKGSVQELLKVTSDTSLKLTIAQWKTPGGHSISKGGLTPAFEVKMTEKDREEGKDPQLEKAVEILLNL